MKTDYERSISQKERDAIPAEDFAGPDRSFPIRSQADVDSAAHLIGHAADPEAVKAKIIAIAKRKGFTLPDAWQEKEEQRSMDLETFSLYLPITRSDAVSRRVFGQATIEQPDSYGTIFGYYPDAWKTWRGNIREQHDPKKAVGRALEVIPDEARRAIDVELTVSRGAQDTWLKVEDGVLTGLSASIKPDPEFGNDISRWPKREVNGKSYPYLPRYSVVELSLVDNPATPGCNIAIVRADGMATEVVDDTPDELPADKTPATPVEAVATGTQERAGARISADTQNNLHSMRDTAMQTCGCDECAGLLGSMGDDDGDGDEDAEDILSERMERVLAPVYARQQQFLARLASNQSDYTAIRTALTDLHAAIERVAHATSLERVQTELAAVKVEVARIAAQPASGGPVLSGAAPQSNPQAGYQERMAFLGHAQEMGLLDTTDKQIRAAAQAVIPARMSGR